VGVYRTMPLTQQEIITNNIRLTYSLVVWSFYGGAGCCSALASSECVSVRPTHDQSRKKVVLKDKNKPSSNYRIIMPLKSPQYLSSFHKTPNQRHAHAHHAHLTRHVCLRSCSSHGFLASCLTKFSFLLFFCFFSRFNRSQLSVQSSLRLELELEQGLEQRSQIKINEPSIDSPNSARLHP
jgi:hypothetical protein